MPLSTLVRSQRQAGGIEGWSANLLPAFWTHCPSSFTALPSVSLQDLPFDENVKEREKEGLEMEHERFRC